MAGPRETDTLPPGTHVLDAPTLIRQAAVLAGPATVERLMANAIRALAIDAAEAAACGLPALPLGMADAATALWTRFLRFDASDPHWPDRDRFVLSAGHGAMLLYALLHLTGYAGMEARDLARFRQLDSPAGGHPDQAAHPGIETTAGPPGQGLANAVGMALAERMMAARFGRSLVDHRTWVIAADADLAEGVGYEAADLAGQLRLEKLTVLWNDHSVVPAGQASAATDTLKRFATQGWATKRVDGHDPAQLSAALSLSLRSKKPTLIACRTLIGLAAHIPTNRAAADSARDALDWRHERFAVPPDLADRWARVGRRGGAARRAWLKRLAKHPLRTEFERVVAGKLPEGWQDASSAQKARFAETQAALPGRQAGKRALAALAGAIPEMVGGSAEIARTTLGSMPPAGAGSAMAPAGAGSAMAPAATAPVGAGSYAGRYVQFGAREHGMAACLNGLALHRGLLPVGATVLAFSDCMRPALRLAAMMQLRLVYLMTHDGIGAGGEGPALQPVEQLAGLRAMPGLHVFRPADAVEVAECWELAIRRADGPSVLALSHQDLSALRQDTGENRCARGGYVLLEADGPRRATLVATGSEVAIAVEARRLLAACGVAVAVVSLPCWELFGQQDERYRLDVLGAAPRFGIEAACGFGWERWLGESGVFLGMTGFGASAPAPDLYRHFGITPDAITAAVTRRVLPN